MFRHLPSRTGPRAGRAGISFLELQVAFVLLAIALAGVGPLVVMQLRQVARYEDRLDDSVTYYIAASNHRWDRRLGAIATISTTDPGVPPPPPPTLIDNTDPGYSELDPGVIDWATVVDAGAHGGDQRRNHAGGVGDTAIWTFSGLDVGRYEVFITYKEAADQSPDAPFTVFDGITALTTTPIDQTVAPVGNTFAGSEWISLGVFSITGDTLKVQVDDATTNFMAADAVRIVGIRNIVTLDSLDKPLGDEQVTAHVSVVEVP